MEAKPFSCRFVCLSILVICLISSTASAKTDNWRYSNVSRVVAISDVHGAHEDMVLTLQSSGVLDERRAWSGGKTHLVLTGDMLDRGADSRHVMDLMRRLESEARRAGGRVHVLLGNHEVMNLIGDLRYVADAEYAAFSKEESATDRNVWFKHYTARAGDDADPLQVAAEFAEKAPPGFFGHRQAFRSDGEYGRWLLEKPLMVVINETAYVHGGLPDYVAEHGLDGVNGTLKADVQDFLEIRSYFEDEKILNPVDRFRDYQSVLAAKIDAGEISGQQATLARELIALRNSPVNHSHGPLWYRGSSYCSSLIESDELAAALQKINATRVVIGHSTTASRKVQQRLDGRVIEINTGMLKPSYGGSGYALIIEEGVVTVVAQDGTNGLVPVELPRRVGYESIVLDDDQIEQRLSTGAILASPTHNRTRRLVQIAAGTEILTAQFSPTRKNTNFAPELAAYRLDKALDLGMIPVTVRRVVDGRQGTLQFVPGEAINERERFVAEGEGSAPCSLEKQRQAIRVFDALIYNPNRSPLTMLFSPDTQTYVLAGHANSFSSISDLPGVFKQTTLKISNQWKKALRALSDKDLHQLLNDVLDERRREALEDRRDLLLE